MPVARAQPARTDNVREGVGPEPIPFQQTTKNDQQKKETTKNGEDLLRSQCRPYADSGQKGGDYRLRLAGARTRVKPQGFWRAGESWPGGEFEIDCQSAKGGTGSSNGCRRREVGRRSDGAGSRSDRSKALYRRDWPQHQAGHAADVCTRIQHPL